MRFLPNFKDGGPAFPQPHANWSENGKEFCAIGNPGMSMRDLIAAMVLQGFCANPTLLQRDGAFQDSNFAMAYQFADAMIEARNRKGEA